MQWPKEKVQQDKQQSTKHAHKTKDQVIQTPLNPLKSRVASPLTRPLFFITEKVAL